MNISSLENLHTETRKKISESSHFEPKKKFGTFIGVYVPSILMLFGVIIFLRLGWILGIAGLYPTLIIITLATSITLITTLSISAAATNIEVGKGGAYYIISRALGLEVGSAVGLPLYLKQSITISFCIVGFAESFQGLFPDLSLVSIGIVTLAVLAGLSYISTNFMLKLQVFIFVSIIASLYSLFTGGEVAEQQPIQDFVFPSLGFWGTFAIFFPAMTGLESAVSLSGDLKNPSRSLPLGVIGAVLTAYAIYMMIPIFLTQYVSREQLVSDPAIIQKVAKFGSLIILGIWGATLSSAIGGLLGAPRTMQALAEDGILPKFLAKEYGPHQEPWIASAVTIVIAFLGVCFGTINQIAPLLTMICLISYAVLNLATGFEDLMSNPSWRPAFPLSWMVSFAGAGLCVVAMLMIDSGSAIVALFLILALYSVIKQKQLRSGWDDIRYGILMFFSRHALYHLAKKNPSSRTWRPNFLVFTGRPSEVSNHLLGFAIAIAQRKGFLTIASFLPEETTKHEEIQDVRENICELMKENRIEAFVSINRSKSIISEMKRMIMHYGMGPLIPNTIVCGGSSKDDHSSYLEMFGFAHAHGKNVVVINEEQRNVFTHAHKNQKMQGYIHIWWDDLSHGNTELMLVLAHMLKKNPCWKRGKLCLMGIARSEQEQDQKQKEFTCFVQRNRLKIETKVILAESMQKEIDIVKRFSTEAIMVFVSMRSPEEFASLEEYASYFQTLPQKTEAFPSVALVMSAKETNLEAVVQITQGISDEELEPVFSY